MNGFMPGLASYLFNSVNGEDLVLDAARVAQIQAVVNGLKAHGSPGLQADLDAFMEDVEALAGTRMSEAIESILQREFPFGDP